MTVHRRQWLGWGLGTVAAAWGSAASSAVLSNVQAHWRERALLGFGTTLWLRAAHPNTDVLEAALQDAVQAIRQIESEMSLFDPDSAVSRLNRTGVLSQPSAALTSVLSLARHVSSRSQGAFDVTVQPLWDLWSQAQRDGTTPSPRVLKPCIAKVNWRALDIHPSALRLQIKGMGVTLNGIAQGHAADQVRTVLQSHGVEHALIDTGETSALGLAQGDTPWRFAIEPSAGTSSPPPVSLPEGWAMATSSDAHTTFSADRRHHHIFDPHTGDSPTHWATVSVLAPSCALADALTKVFFMCPPERLTQTAHAWGVAAVLQSKQGKWVRVGNPSA